MGYVAISSGMLVPKNRLIDAGVGVDRSKNLVINGKQGVGKYGSKRAAYDGVIFDSIAEREYYRHLKARMGDLSLVTFQEMFELQPKFEVDGKVYRKISYRPDFIIRDQSGNIRKVVDVKGYETDLFKIKGKMFSYKYNIPLILARYDHRSKTFREEQL